MFLFEKDLKVLLDTSDGNLLYAPFSLSTERLEFLQAKGYIKIKYADNKPYYLFITSTGKTYFIDQQIEKRKTLRQWGINTSVAIASGAFGSVLTLFLQYVFIK